jgi:hypothetical protein
MCDDAPQKPEIHPVDIQRLLLWYFGSVDPGRPHIRRRGWDDGRPAAMASAGL